MGPWTWSCKNSCDLWFLKSQQHSGKQIFFLLSPLSTKKNLALCTALQQQYRKCAWGAQVLWPFRDFSSVQLDRQGWLLYWPVCTGIQVVPKYIWATTSRTHCPVWIHRNQTPPSLQNSHCGQLWWPQTTLSQKYTSHFFPCSSLLSWPCLQVIWPTKKACI